MKMFDPIFSLFSTFPCRLPGLGKTNLFSTFQVQGWPALWQLWRLGDLFDFLSSSLEKACHLILVSWWLFTCLYSFFFAFLVEKQKLSSIISKQHDQVKTISSATIWHLGKIELPVYIAKGEQYPYPSSSWKYSCYRHPSCLVPGTIVLHIYLVAMHSFIAQKSINKYSCISNNILFLSQAATSLQPNETKVMVPLCLWVFNEIPVASRAYRTWLCWGLWVQLSLCYASSYGIISYLLVKLRLRSNWLKWFLSFVKVSAQKPETKGCKIWRDFGCFIFGD